MTEGIIDITTGKEAFIVDAELLDAMYEIDALISDTE
jgi:hypothetical protein